MVYVHFREKAACMPQMGEDLMRTPVSFSVILGWQIRSAEHLASHHDVAIDEAGKQGQTDSPLPWSYS